MARYLAHAKDSKYISREKDENGKWQYYYVDDEGNRIQVSGNNAKETMNNLRDVQREIQDFAYTRKKYGTRGEVPVYFKSDISVNGQSLGTSSLKYRPIKLNAEQRKTYREDGEWADSLQKDYRKSISGNNGLVRRLVKESQVSNGPSVNTDKTTMQKTKQASVAANKTRSATNKAKTAAKESSVAQNEKRISNNTPTVSKKTSAQIKMKNTDRKIKNTASKVSDATTKAVNDLKTKIANTKKKKKNSK